MFARAILTAPLFADAWFGLYRSEFLLGNKDSAERSLKIHRLLKDRVNPRYTFLSSRQVLAWVLFLCGIFTHSWISGIAIIAALTLYAAALQFIPLTFGAGSLNLVYNLGALVVAVGGHYLRPSWMTWGWLFVLILIFTIAWSPVERLLLDHNLPLLSLPFNVFLFDSLIRLRLRG